MKHNHHQRHCCGCDQKYHRAEIIANHRENQFCNRQGAKALLRGDAEKRLGALAVAKLIFPMVRYNFSTMIFLITAAAVALMVIVLHDAFESVILPRRVTRPLQLTRLFYNVAWPPWSAASRWIRQRRSRESFLSF